MQVFRIGDECIEYIMFYKELFNLCNFFKNCRKNDGQIMWFYYLGIEDLLI